MSIFVNTVLGLYTIALLIITAYCLMQLHLLFSYQRSHFRKRKAAKLGLPAKKENLNYPFVTIQLPIFNEMYVVERLIDNIMKMEYPKDRFEVHVLDDSIDETLEITKKKVEEYQAKGF